MTVKLASTLPEGEGNGLVAIVADLVTRPEDTHVVVAVIDTVKLTTDIDSGDVTPTARVRRVEVMSTAEARSAAHKLLREAHGARTGKDELPIEDP